MKTRQLMAAFLALCFGASMLVLTACNTTEGAGEDIEGLGEGIQDAAD